MDKINPNYYKAKTIETIEAIRSQLSTDEFRGYLKGQVWKKPLMAQRSTMVKKFLMVMVGEKEV